MHYRSEYVIIVVQYFNLILKDSMIGQRLRELRLAKNISMDQIEEMTGITDSRLSRIERGLIQHVAFEDVINLLKAFDVPLIAFLCNEGYCEIDNSVLKNVELLNEFEIAHVQSEIDFILKEKGLL